MKDMLNNKKETEKKSKLIGLKVEKSYYDLLVKISKKNNKTISEQIRSYLSVFLIVQLIKKKHKKLSAKDKDVIGKVMDFYNWFFDVIENLQNMKIDFEKNYNKFREMLLKDLEKENKLKRRA